MFYQNFEYPVVALVFLLTSWHFIADYPLQSDFIAAGKNRHTEIGKQFWVWVLPAHSFIHGFGVMLITGNVWLGIMESVVHFIVDLMKCDNRITLHQDQCLHLFSKLCILIIALYT